MNLFRKICRENQWLPKIIAKMSSFSVETIRKAGRGEKVNFNTKFEIFCSLKNLWLLPEGIKNPEELFKKIEDEK